jgi:NAD(P)-dependent dehydrogenase (short-subunit alcohol dehydrogenase family)
MDMAISIDFSGKVALITGAARGIGLATAQAFAEAGASLVLADLSEEVEEAAAALRKMGAEAVSCTVDVSDASSCQSMARMALDKYGRLDFAFNNAGIGSQEVPVGDIEESAWRRMLDINLTGVFLGVKYQVPAMLKTGGGVIVNNSSILGTRALPRSSIEYTAAKHGVIGLTRQLAVNHAHEGIRCFAVCPGLVDTPLVAVDPEAGLAKGGVDDGMRKWFMERIPTARFATPEDIAGAVVMMCSDRASYVNGTHLLIDGGLVQG